eukprot:scaffold4979_cov73-Cylindrotheca_fusiformis.AAC.5
MVGWTLGFSSFANSKSDLAMGCGGSSSSPLLPLALDMLVFLFYGESLKIVRQVTQNDSYRVIVAMTAPDPEEHTYNEWRTASFQSQYEDHPPLLVNPCTCADVVLSDVSMETGRRESCDWAQSRIRTITLLVNPCTCADVVLSDVSMETGRRESCDRALSREALIGKTDIMDSS